MNSKVTVADVMTTDVVTVPPTAPFKEVARVLVSRGISAVPVVDEESRLLGVVSEADLLVKESGSTGWKRPAMIAGAKRWRKWAKARATTAAEAMTPAVKSIEPTASLSEAARRLTEERLRRLFVVEDGKLVGVIARRDAVRAFLADDEDLRETIRTEVLRDGLWLDPDTIEVSVRDGVVTLRGTVERRSEVALAESMTARTPGVVDVRNELTYRIDDRDVEQEMAEARRNWRKAREGFDSDG
ncbi:MULTISPECIES: CBS domain-containing protein [Thermocrispum]|jgi:CBS domain-containing protein|uniref:CBS domain-containing protein n=2 Tax=Thermocrispum agreste TaxID=37925 RepID=A0ABD6FBX1_9PSEU|nr:MULTISPECIES: CBS domain-containing protein [Thermocrispum]